MSRRAARADHEAEQLSGPDPETHRRLDPPDAARNSRSETDASTGHLQLHKSSERGLGPERIPDRLGIQQPGSAPRGRAYRRSAVVFPVQLQRRYRNSDWHQGQRLTVVAEPEHAVE